MPTPLLSDPLLQSRAGTLQTLLNSGHTLRLFQNAITPTPATPLSSFTECTFTGYASISLASAFGTPTQVTSGQWQTQAAPFTFSCTGGSAQTIYGWYVDDGTNMVMCQLLDSPFTISSGLQFVLQVAPQEISQSIL